MSKKGFTQLKDLIPAAAGKRGVSREVEAAFVCSRAKKAIAKIWGPDSREVRPLFWKDGILTLEADSSAQAQDAYMKKALIMDEVGELKDIKIRVKG